MKGLPATTISLHGNADVVANARCLLSPKTGVQRYASELLKRLAYESVEPLVRLPGPLGHLWEQCILPSRIGGNAVLFSPANTGPLAVARQVVTVHDAATLDHPEWFSTGFARWYQWLLPRLIKSVAHVVTVSEFSKGRLLHFCDVGSEKITVIPNGVSILATKASSGNVPNKPYFLYVGSLEPRKNLPVLLNAWRLAGLPNFDLKIAGGLGGGAFKKQKFATAPDSVCFLGHVSDSELADLYSSCSGFVYPSLYEGFGLPPLEAMAYGALPLVSDIPVHREVCGDAAHYFRLDRPDELIDCLRWAANLDPSQRLDFSAKGRLCVSRFSWERTAVQTAAVLQSVV